MSTIRFKQVEAVDIDAMVTLLMARQIKESTTFPQMLNEHLNKAYLENTLHILFKEKEMLGCAAFLDDVMVGYIVAQIVENETKGNLAWVPYEGLAIHMLQSAELIRNMYAFVSSLWLARGCVRHSVFVPLGQTAYFEAFMRLSFAINQVHAVLDLDAYIPFSHNDAIHVRPMQTSDASVLGSMSGIIASYQSKPPTFVPVTPEILETRRKAFENLVHDKDVVVFIAEKDEQVVGFCEYEFMTPSLLTSSKSIELCVAGTIESKRHMGIGKQLMNASVVGLKAMAYTTVFADWKISNLTSSTFWPLCGFKPFSYQMTRSIDSSFDSRSHTR